MPLQDTDLTPSFGGFGIKQVDDDQLSEEFVSSLNAIERTMKRIKIAVNSIEGQLYSGNPAIATSAEAIWAIVQVELSHISRSYGNYADAIHYLDQASNSYISALDGCTDDPLSDDGSNWRREDNAWIKSLKRANVAVGDESNAWKEIINRQLSPLHMPLAEAASLFDSLKHSPSDDLNWNQIAKDCAGLAYLPQLEWEIFSGVENQETIEDDEGFDVSWSEFWRHAHAWASAQLSPSEHRKMRDEDEQNAAERRLKVYFFGSNWDHLPQRAQKRLVNADILWNSNQKVARESVINELLRATEEMCYQFIWNPLEQSITPKNQLPTFVERICDLAENRKSPGVRDYIWIFRQGFCRGFLTDRLERSFDIAFMTKKLPNAIDRLNKVRGHADHEPDGYETKASFSYEDIQSLFREFLGIGQPGILPELARIGRKLQSSAK